MSKTIDDVLNILQKWHIEEKDIPDRISAACTLLCACCVVEVVEGKEEQHLNAAIESMQISFPSLIFCLRKINPDEIT